MVPLKIERIEISHYDLPLDPPFRAAWDPVPRRSFPATVVRVVTDDGIVGIGSGDPMAGFHDFEHLFLGRDLLDLDRHGRVLDTLSFHAARYWPFEVALWDAAGKALSQPISRLLGGGAPALPSYCSTGEIHPASQRAEEALRLTQAGFHALKLRLAGGRLSADLAVVAAVREAVGPEIEIMVDANQGWRMPGDPSHPWDARTAIAAARDLRQLGIYWLEEPLHRHDYAGLRELREATGVRIAGGEMNRELGDFREYCSQRALDVLQPDVVVSGGFGWGKEVAALCRSHGLLYSPHTWGNGVGLAANLHIAAASGLCPYLEYPLDAPGWTEERRDFLLAQPLRTDANGILALPDAPGLGVQLHEDLERFRIDR